ncbi:MAG: DUF2851 family protein [Chryseolinea sp.]
MTESFLHYLWQFQYFDKRDLRSTLGEELSILHPGYKNVHSGPDFFNARIKIGAIEWVGNVEIHIFASGWLEHKHNGDPAYENVVLHVVWQSDKKVNRSDGSDMSTLTLNGRVAERLLIEYGKLAQNPEQIPCAMQFDGVREITRISMMERTLTERIEAKAAGIQKMLIRNNRDWEETGYQTILRNFGFKVNSEPFEQLAHALPYKILMKHADKQIQIEALLFGQAGFLEDNHGDEYYKTLQREYGLLGRKYQLTTRKVSKVQWRFLRLRPANFPTIRIAQFAALIYQRRNIFSTILSLNSGAALQKFFAIRQSDYWIHHYQFIKQIKEEVATLGEASTANIIINSVVPLLVAYGKSRDEEEYLVRAISILQHMRAETNMITRNWKSLGLASQNAFDSQALVQLYNHYCLKRRCLDCAIGASIVNPGNA